MSSVYTLLLHNGTFYEKDAFEYMIGSNVIVVGQKEIPPSPLFKDDGPSYRYHLVLKDVSVTDLPRVRKVVNDERLTPLIDNGQPVQKPMQTPAPKPVPKPVPKPAKVPAQAPAKAIEIVPITPVKQVQVSTESSPQCPCVDKSGNRCSNRPYNGDKLAICNPFHMCFQHLTSWKSEKGNKRLTDFEWNPMPTLNETLNEGCAGKAGDAGADDIGEKKASQMCSCLCGSGGQCKNSPCSDGAKIEQVSKEFGNPFHMCYQHLKNWAEKKPLKDSGGSPMITYDEFEQLVLSAM